MNRQRLPRPVTTTTADQATIGKSLVIKGEVTGSESLYIDGRVEGSINLSGNRVTVGRNGVVAANINAREIVVLGKVRGNLTASDRVDIRSDGSLTGDVIAARISIEDGAFFKGGIDIRKGGQPQQQQKANGEEKAVPAERTGSRGRTSLGSFASGLNWPTFSSGHPPRCPFRFWGELEKLYRWGGDNGSTAPYDDPSEEEDEGDDGEKFVGEIFPSLTFPVSFLLDPSILSGTFPSSTVFNSANRRENR